MIRSADLWSALRARTSYPQFSWQRPTVCWKPGSFLPLARDTVEVQRIRIRKSRNVHGLTNSFDGVLFHNFRIFV